MNNASNRRITCHSSQASHIFWSNTLLNGLNILPTCSTEVEVTLKPCFSLAHTSLFTPSESLLALMHPLETHYYVDETDDVAATNNSHMSMFIGDEDAQSVSDRDLFVQCLS